MPMRAGELLGVEGRHDPELGLELATADPVGDRPELVERQVRAAEQREVDRAAFCREHLLLLGEIAAVMTNGVAGRVAVKCGLERGRLRGDPDDVVHRNVAARVQLRAQVHERLRAHSSLGMPVNTGMKAVCKPAFRGTA